jgi:hypothetical protein
MLEPIYARDLNRSFKPPEAPDERYEEVIKLARRVGGNETRGEFVRLIAGGWTGAVAKNILIECIGQSRDALEDTNVVAGNKRKRPVVASIAMRKGIWDVVKDRFPAFALVAQRVLSVRPTSCASERNWNLWGRVYTASMNALGKNRAQKMITFCFISCAQKEDMNYLELQLALVEESIRHPQSQSTKRVSEDNVELVE